MTDITFKKHNALSFLEEGFLTHSPISSLFSCSSDNHSVLQSHGPLTRWVQIRGTGLAPLFLAILIYSIGNVIHITIILYIQLVWKDSHSDLHWTRTFKNKNSLNRSQVEAIIICFIKSSSWRIIEKQNLFGVLEIIQ